MSVIETTVRADTDASDDLPPYSLALVWDPDDRIFVVTVPELPGCRTHGATYEAAAANAREAIASWVSAARDFGDRLPAPRVERHLVEDEPPAPSEKVSA
jgi:predicted RNase H-like HicB family nuclease